MKKAENNEIDLLLRSLARRKGSLPGKPMIDDSTQSGHLDADELISYAEQTLPAATRARYTIHLADCSQCRKIVAQLAPAVSVGVRDHPEEQGVTTFWQTIRHFFSLPVLRYAVPALGLFAIVVVGLVVFRQQSPDMVAKYEPTARQVAITESQPTETLSQTPTAETEENKSLHDSAPNLNAKRKAESTEQGQATGAGPGVSAPVVSEKDSADKTTVAVAQPTFAPEPPPAAPKPQDQVAEVRKEKDTRTDTAARAQSVPLKDTDKDAYTNYQKQPAKEEEARIRVQPKESQAAGTASTNAARDREIFAGRRRESLRVASGAAGTKADDETAETRVVAGRRFRKQGSLWIDTAYQSGLSLTVISRGSEPYRALVADEPSIRTIAEQLQGEVILIWKGRGYRIR